MKRYLHIQLLFIAHLKRWAFPFVEPPQRNDYPRIAKYSDPNKGSATILLYFLDQKNKGKK
ncbi:hypothetical protein F9B74_02690 [Pelistega sp. NLN82]|uniref:Uncharacterized protein n=1 Tax=Pelistega ratti TaxID=2652177 RepID=A0A6L9Y4R9_9BURK|nr:hypothetical protein [Pelistega ratti]NEN75236.1 hypothetical protein [Pelistega ratti]